MTGSAQPRAVSETPKRAVFLDRDGVLNAATVVDGMPRPPRSVEEMEILPGVPEACSRLHEAGFVLVLVTNQPDVARGRSTVETVRKINAAVSTAAGLDDVRVCFHDDDDSCDCRKPNPGMLLDASRELSLELSESYLVGDRWRDIEAGHRAGVQTVLIDYGYQEPNHVIPAKTVRDLTEASEWIIAQVNSKGGEL